MNFDTLAGIYTYAMDHHTGQWSRLYRLMSRIRFSAPDHVFTAIQGNRHSKRDDTRAAASWDEWEGARRVYRTLKRRKAQ
jgi:hypothetical protein